MIPNIFHFVYLGFTEFTYVHYLSIISCKIINNPDTIYLYYNKKRNRNTIWWNKIQKIVILEFVELPTMIFGNPITKYQHMCDIIRLEKLILRGGVYYDLDVVSTRPVTKLLKNKCVMGKQCTGTEYEGLCNAVILAEQDSLFLKKWYDHYKYFDKSKWDYHSVKLPLKLAKAEPHLLKILGKKYFFPFDWTQEEFLKNRNLDYLVKDCYTIHLWDSLWEKTVLKNASPILLNKNTSFSYIVKNIVDKFIHKDKNNTVSKAQNKITSKFKIKLPILETKKQVIEYKKFIITSETHINKIIKQIVIFCKKLNDKIDIILGLLVYQQSFQTIYNCKGIISRVEVNNNLAIIDKKPVYVCSYNELKSLSDKVVKQPDYRAHGEININGDKMPLILYKNHKGIKYAYFGSRLYKLVYPIISNFKEIVNSKLIYEKPITKINNLSYFKINNKISQYFILGKDDKFINIGYLRECELLYSVSSNIRLWNIKPSRNKFIFTMHYKNGNITKVIPSTKIFPLRNIKIDGNLFYRSNSYLL